MLYTSSASGGGTAAWLNTKTAPAPAPQTPVVRPVPVPVRMPVSQPTFTTTAATVKAPNPVTRPTTPTLAQASALPTTNPRDVTASGTTNLPDGSSVNPSFSVAGGNASITPGSGATTGSDYTWVLYVVAGLGLLYVTLYKRKG
jgi:hypothetical protein